jgi:hypothetical protein
MSTNTYLTKFPYEQELIEFCKTVDDSDFDPPNNSWSGYNPKVHTKEMYKEHSKKMKGKSFATPKSRAATILSNQTRILSDETRKKMSESQKKRYIENPDSYRRWS